MRPMMPIPKELMQMWKLSGSGLFRVVLHVPYSAPHRQYRSV